jgi:hypothetical protein
MVATQGLTPGGTMKMTPLPSSQFKGHFTLGGLATSLVTHQ